jgi:drug/metabolite transporter (DMT)-like permease
MNIQPNQKATLAAFFCNFFWGLSFLASRIALNEASVSVLLSHRFLVAFIVMSIYVLLGHLLLPVVLLPDKAQCCPRDSICQSDHHCLGPRGSDGAA